MNRGLLTVAAGVIGFRVGLLVAQNLPSEVKEKFARRRYDGSEVSLLGCLPALGGCWMPALPLTLSADKPAKNVAKALVVSNAFATISGLVDDHLESYLEGQCSKQTGAAKNDQLLEAEPETSTKPVPPKGLKGHLHALKSGHVTTGVLKIALGGLSGLTGAVYLQKARKVGKDSAFKSGSLVVNSAHFFTDAILIAGTSNLINLFDLRPGRALKIVALTGLLASRSSRKQTLAGNSAAAGGANIARALTVSSLCQLPQDLSGKTMLGDCGAVTLGNSVGVALAARENLATKMTCSALCVGLILLSEKVSFSQIIAKNPALNWLDQLGR